MAAKTTDAELVQILRLAEEHGSAEAAARATGRSPSAIRTLVRRAHGLGLTATSPVVDELAKVKAKLQQAERRIKVIQFEADTADSIRKEIYKLAAVSPEPPKWVSTPAKSGHGPGIPMALWSDWHWGEVVKAGEVGGVNEFNSDVAKVRVKKLVDATIDLCINHMVNPQYPGIVICLGGDMISGDIHEELADTNDSYTMVALNDILDSLIAALSLLADTFGQVFVPCVVGNHGRTTKKPRMKGRVYSSFEWNLYNQLERWFRNDKRIKFFIPGETDAYFVVNGRRFLLTHGDSLGVKGGDGIIGSLGPIRRGAIKVGRSESQIGRQFDTILMGHWHQYIALPDLIVNGSLKGYDEYARLGLRAPYERPTQALWFVHPKHGITAQWPVYLEDQKVSQQEQEWVSWLKQAA